MKHLNQFITEYIIKKKLDKPIDSEHNYKYFPATRQELFKITQELIDKGQYDLNCINTERITDMNNLFIKAPDIDISQWDVSNVKNMSHMFVWCENFNCDLSKWDVSNVENMSHMFYKCENFEGKGLENWYLSNVKYMSSIFKNCEKFDCDVSNWNIRNVIYMDYAFINCLSFTGKGLDKWNPQSLKDSEGIFDNCKSIKKYPKWYTHWFK